MCLRHKCTRKRTLTPQPLPSPSGPKFAKNCSMVCVVYMHACVCVCVLLIWFAVRLSRSQQAPVGRVLSACLRSHCFAKYVFASAAGAFEWRPQFNRRMPLKEFDVVRNSTVMGFVRMLSGILERAIASWLIVCQFLMHIWCLTVVHLCFSCLYCFFKINLKKNCGQDSCIGVC